MNIDISSSLLGLHTNVSRDGTRYFTAAAAVEAYTVPQPPTTAFEDQQHTRLRRDEHTVAKTHRMDPDVVSAGGAVMPERGHLGIPSRVLRT